MVDGGGRRAAGAGGAVSGGERAAGEGDRGGIRFETLRRGPRPSGARTGHGRDAALARARTRRERVRARAIELARIRRGRARTRRSAFRAGARDLAPVRVRFRVRPPAPPRPPPPPPSAHSRSLLVGFANPAYESFRAVEAYRARPGPTTSARLFEWACYWVAAGAFECLETPLRDVVDSVPFYSIAKLALLAWLQARGCAGSKRVVSEVLSPRLRPWLATVDPVVAAVRASLRASVALLQLDAAFAWLAKRIPGLSWFLNDDGGDGGETWSDQSGGGAGVAGATGGAATLSPQPPAWAATAPTGQPLQSPTFSASAASGPYATAYSASTASGPYATAYSAPAAASFQSPGTTAAYVVPRGAPTAATQHAVAAAFPPIGSVAPAETATAPTPSGGSASRRWLSRAIWRGDSTAEGSAPAAPPSPPQPSGGGDGRHAPDSPSPEGWTAVPRAE